MPYKNFSIIILIIVFLFISSNGLGINFVKGSNLFPNPPAIITAAVFVSNGYKFKLKTPVTAKSGKKTYDLFSKGRFAWVVDDKDEIKLIVTMKKASRIMVVGSTDKGDQTTDHYSMMGFTKAYNTAKKNCI